MRILMPDLPANAIEYGGSHLSYYKLRLVYIVSSEGILKLLVFPLVYFCTTKAYFPIQKELKIFPSRSSDVNSPVISER